MTSSDVLPPWSIIAQQKQAQRASKIPQKWSAPSINSLDDIERHLSLEERAITNLSASALAIEIKTGSYSVVQVVRAFCHRAALAHQLTNCFTEILFDEALERAAQLDAQSHKSQPLFGLPITVKDSIKIKGYDSSIGYIAYCNDPAQDNSLLFDLLIASGAVVIAKTNVPQTLMPNDSHNNVFGRTLNPHNLLCTPGGSSGGEGAAMACRASVLSITTDVGGSTRIPALCCGVYGLRPSAHRIPYKNLRLPCPEAVTLIPSVLGPLANDPADFRLFWNAVLDKKPWLFDHTTLPIPARNVAPAPKFSVAYISSYGEVIPHPPVLRALNKTIDALSRDGHPIVELRDFPQDDNLLRELSTVLLSIDSYKSTLDIIRAGNEPIVESVAKLSITDYPLHTIDAVIKAIHDRQELQDKCHDIIQKYIPGDYDVFILPAAPHTAVAHDMYVNMDYSVLFNVLDWPAAVVPVTTVDPAIDLPRSLDMSGKSQMALDTENLWSPKDLAGLPVAVQVVGKRHKEEELIESLISISNSLKKYT